MVIKETSIFTKIIQELMVDEEYVALQESLVCNPSCGDLIRGSGGLRKIRWKISDKGKPGGVRIIYYFLGQENQIYMLYAYQKNKQSDLTSEQLKQLKIIVTKELNHETN